MRLKKSANLEAANLSRWADAPPEVIMTKFKVTTEHCFFDYFPVAFRFEDLCLCESHAREVFEKLSAAQQSVRADGRVLCACIPPLADTNSMGKCEACGCARR